MTTSTDLWSEGARLARTISKPSDLRGALDIALPVVLVGLAIALLLIADFHWVACIVAFFMFSKAQYSLLLSGHEAAHHLLFTSRRLNDWVGAYMCFGPVGVSFNVARAAHLDHHRYLLTEKDLKLDQQISNPTKRRLLAHIVRPLFGYYLIKGVLRLFGVTFESRVKPTFVVTPDQRRADLASIALSSITLMVVLTAIDWRLYPFFWIAPLFTLLAFLHNSRAMLDHVRLPGEPDGLLYSYEVRWFDRLLVGTQQYNHAEHHLYPGVPHHRLAKLRPITSMMSDVRYRRSSLSCLIEYYRMLPA